jgi:hypothetical protein
VDFLTPGRILGAIEAISGQNGCVTIMAAQDGLEVLSIRIPMLIEKVNQHRQVGMLLVEHKPI